MWFNTDAGRNNEILCQKYRETGGRSSFGARRGVKSLCHIKLDS